MLPIHIIHRLRSGRLWQPWAVERKLPVLVFMLALVGLIAGAAGGPGWWPSAHANLAAVLRHAAAAPLYGLVANVAAALPIGELGFRLAVLSAVLGAALIAGVVAAARAMLPKDPVAWIVAAVLLAVAPAFRDAAGFAGPDILAACGIVWMIRFTATSCWRPALGCAAVCVSVCVSDCDVRPVQLAAKMRISAAPLLNRALRPCNGLTLPMGRNGDRNVKAWMERRS